MMYVEWLRARRALIVVGVILAAFVVLALGLKIWLVRYETTGQYINLVQAEPGTTQQHVTLPDGTKRTIYDNPGSHTHIVVDDRGYSGQRVVIDAPHKDGLDISRSTIGSTQITTSNDGKLDHIVVETDHGSTLAPYLGVAWFLAMIVATILGAPFARENDGHLEIALTKPVSRTVLALGMVVTDALAMIATIAGTVIVLMILTLLFEPLRISGDDALLMIASTVLVPLGWYALLNAVTASLRRAYGVILGLSWPVLFGINGFVAIPWNDSTFGRLGYALSHTFYTLNPISYLTLGSGVHIETGGSTAAETFSHTSLGMLVALALFIVYTALAVVQWRRVEA